MDRLIGCTHSALKDPSKSSKPMVCTLIPLIYADDILVIAKKYSVFFFFFLNPRVLLEIGNAMSVRYDRVHPLKALQDVTAIEWS